MQTLWLKVWGSGVVICMCVYDSFAPSLLTHATNNWSANWTRELFHVSTCVPGQMTAAQHLKKKAAACNQDALSASNGLVLDLRARRHFRVQLQKGRVGGHEGIRGLSWKTEGDAFLGRWRLVDLRTGCFLFSLGRGEAVWSRDVWQRWQQMRQEVSVMKFGFLFFDELWGMMRNNLQSPVDESSVTKH